jgi:hypothetical protein
LLEEPVLVATFSPLRETVGFEIFAVIAEAFDDVGVSDTIENPLIDLVAVRRPEEMSSIWFRRAVRQASAWSSVSWTQVYGGG